MSKQEMIEIVHEVLEDKLKKCHDDYIDIRFSREQAEELHSILHRIIKRDENMKGENNDQTGKD